MLAKRTPCFANEASIEAGQCIDPREQKVAVVAITDNAIAGRFGRGLKPLTQASFEMGQKISKRSAGMLAPYRYGKAAPIVLNGKQEHAAVAVTVLGNVMRDAAGGGKAWIFSITKLAAPGRDQDTAERDRHVRALANRSRPDDRVCGFAAGAPTA